ncbi:hypothetical protein ABNF97_09515 [Plantactinospora sp. B6F1]|uniref:hypothetical protein n=1 Tax=Plantactinospora sp. B6F1 TaxID=3158971 RepID=UPI0032D93376
MKLRLYGTPAEVNAAVDLVKRLFVVWSVSRHYQNTSVADPGTVRVYVHAELPAGTGDKS